MNCARHAALAAEVKACAGWECGTTMPLRSLMVPNLLGYSNILALVRSSSFFISKKMVFLISNEWHKWRETSLKLTNGIAESADRYAMTREGHLGWQERRSLAALFYPTFGMESWARPDLWVGRRKVVYYRLKTAPVIGIPIKGLIIAIVATS